MTRKQRVSSTRGRKAESAEPLWVPGTVKAKSAPVADVCAWCDERHEGGPEYCDLGGQGAAEARAVLAIQAGQDEEIFVPTYRPTTRTMRALAAIPDELAVWRPKPEAWTCRYQCKGVQLIPNGKVFHVWDCPYWWWNEGANETPF